MKRFLFSVHAVFVLVGIANTILGPMLPVLSQRWHLGDGQSGALFLAQFVGGFAGAVISTRLARRFSLHGITRTGLLLIAVGFLGLASPSLVLASIGIALDGIGLGFCTPSITAAVSEAFPERRASLLNLLNFAWAVGAITAPNLVLAAMRHTRFHVPAMLTSYALVMVVGAFVIPKIAVSGSVQPASTEKLAPGTLRLIVACGALIFLYVGVESGVAGWLPTFATRIHGFGVERTMLLQSTFWTAFLLGRLLAPLWLKAVSERLLLSVSMLLTFAGTVLLLLVPASPRLFVAAILVGAGCAAVFPTAIAVLTHRLGEKSGSNLGFMFASAGLGAAVMPFCIGAVSTLAHSLRRGMWVLVVAEAGLLTAHVAMSRLANRETDPSDIPRVVATGA